MNRFCRALMCPALLYLALLAAHVRAAQDDAAPAQPADEPAPAAATDALPEEQGQVAEKYRRLEDLIFKMADFEATSNPRRAALLRQAYKQSKDRLTQSQLAAIVALLSETVYAGARRSGNCRKDLQNCCSELLSRPGGRIKTKRSGRRPHSGSCSVWSGCQRSLRDRPRGARSPTLAQSRPRSREPALA